MQNAQYAI